MQIENPADSESLPLKRSRLDIRDFLAKGVLIDAKDSMNNWCVATVIELRPKEEMLWVRYDGWAAKWNEDFSINSKKIMPFRRVSVGYTGTKIPNRDYSFSLDDLQKSILLMQKIMKDDFEELDCFNVTQILRGRFFIYIDNLLSYDYEPEDHIEEHIPEVLKVLFLYVELAAKFLVKFQGLYVQYQRGMQNGDLFLSEKDVALALCLYEIIETLVYIFNGSKRCQAFYKRFYKYLDDPENIYDIPFQYTYTPSKPATSEEDVMKDEDDSVSTPRILLKLIDHFLISGAYKSLIHHLTTHPIDPESTSKDPINIPFFAYKLILRLLKLLTPYLNQPTQTELITLMKTGIERRFAGLTERDLKDVDKEFLMEILGDCKVLIGNISTSEDISALVETLELQLAYKLLVCPFFEKRLKGIVSLNEIAERIDYTEKYGKYNESLYSKTASVCRYLTSEIFTKWISENHLLNILLGDSIHIEILKRAHELFKFLCKRKTLLPEIIEQIWQACEGKHDSIIRALYDIIILLSSYMGKDSLHLLYLKLKSIDIRSYHELSLNLLKEFCESVVNLSENSIRSLEGIEITETFIEENFFGLKILWKLLLDDSPLNVALTEEALTAFKSLILSPNCKPLRKHFLALCVREVEKVSSIPQCLFLIMKIIHINYARKADSENQMRTFLSYQEKSYNLTTLVIGDLKRYFTKVRTEQPEKLGKVNMFDEVFEGKHSHRQNLETRLSFLETFAQHALLSEAQLSTLWGLFVMNPNHPTESLIYFGWLARQSESVKGEISIILAKPLLSFQFKEIICNPSLNDFRSMKEEAFALFTMFFLTVNGQERYLRVDKTGKVSNVATGSLLGLDVLWRIFEENINQKVIDKVSELLAELHLKVAAGNGDIDAKRKESAERFTKLVMNNLKEAYANSKKQMINKTIYLLIVFFEKFEGKFFKTSGRISNNAFHYINLSVILRPENLQKEIRMNIYDQIGTFRQKIAEEFGIPLKQVCIMRKNESMYGDSDDDELTIREFGLNTVYFVARKKDDGDDNYHPKHLISESQEYLDLLFRLLSEAEPECLNNIWNLLMKLPSNENIKSSLVNLAKPFEELIEVKSFYKCLYCLQILDELTFARDEKTNPEAFFETDWHLVFLSSQGLEFLVHLFIAQNNSSFATHLSKKFMSILLKLIFFYQKRVNLSLIFQPFPDILTNLCLKLLDTIHTVCEYSIHREQQNLENCQVEKDNYQKSYQSNHSKPDFSKAPAFFIEEADILFYCQEFLLNIINCNLGLLELIYSYPFLDRILTTGLVLSDNLLLREKFSLGLSDLFRAYGAGDLPLKPHMFFLPIFLNRTLENAFLKLDRADYFFHLLMKTLDEALGNWEVIDPQIALKYQDSIDFRIDFQGLLNKLSHLIRTKNFAEDSFEKELFFAYGLNLIKTLLGYCQPYSQDIGSELELIDELLFKCLFVVKNKGPGHHSSYKCKGSHSREAAYSLVNALTLNSTTNLQKVVQFFLPMLRDSDWRTKGFRDWNITPKFDEKSSTGYVGLKNLGCICYMNSLMQQLFMIPSFRNFVLQVEDKNYLTTPKEDNVLYQLKCMFLALRESEKQFYNPRYFCNAFKDWEGNPTNVYEQRDVDEYLNMFMDRLENLTKGTTQETFLKNTFGGYLSNEFICKDCPHYSEREEPFLAVSLQVKNKKTIEESLASFVEGEILEGQNAYLCEQCNKKVTAVKRICLKKLPNHLICVLKRFEFDYDNMSKVKINDSCEFPTRINLEKYTQYGLRKKEKKEGNMETEETETFPEGYFDYELKGVVIHMGIADSGHYYSIIQDREKNEEKWYEFNDTWVKDFDPRDIPNEAFGGEEKWSYFTGNMGNYKERIKNAYLVFYDRVKPIVPQTVLAHEESKELEIEKTTTPNEIPKEPPTDPLEEFHNEIVENNFKFHIHRNVFSQEFFNFIDYMVTELHCSKNKDHLPYPYEYDPIKDEAKWRELEVLKLGLIFLLTCVIREKERTCIIKVLPFLKNKLKKNVPLSLWFLSGMSVKSTLEEFFLLCPNSDMRKFLTGLVQVAMKRVFKAEINIIKENDPQNASVLLNFINTCVNFLADLRTKSYDATEFYKLFLHAARTDPLIAVYLIQNSLYLRLMKTFYVAMDSSHEFPKLAPLPTREPEICFLGKPNEVQKKAMTRLEELKQKKKEKMWLENNNTNRLFLWKTIWYLIRYYKINKTAERNSLQIGTYDFELKQFEISIYLHDLDALFCILNDCNYKVSVKAVSETLAYLCFENLKFSDLAMKVVFKGLKERDANSFRAFYAVLKKLLRIKDSLTEKRVDRILHSFLLFMNENSNYPQDMFYHQQLILKLAGTELAVQRYLKENPDTISWIINWIVDTEMTRINSNSVAKTNVLRYNRFKVPKSTHEYRSFCNEKISKIKKIIKGEYELVPESWDSDDDTIDQKFNIGDKLDFYHSGLNGWITARVEKALDELIFIQVIMNEKPVNKIWKSVDLDDLAPFMSMQEKGETVTGMEIETRDSTEKNAGSNEASDNEQPMLRNANSLNDDPENQQEGNTPNEI